MQKYSIFHDSDERLLKEWHRPYADAFKGHRPVLDVGCGPGYFADLLADRGIACTGLDIDPEMVAACKARGHVALLGDVSQIARGTMYGGIHISHVVEHLWGDQVLELLKTCALILKEGGIVVVRTPNWGNDKVRRQVFWLDHMHKRPYPTELLAKLLVDTGFNVLETGAEPYGLNDLYVVACKQKMSSALDCKLSFGPDPFRNHEGRLAYLSQRARSLTGRIRRLLKNPVFWRRRCL